MPFTHTLGAAARGLQSIKDNIQIAQHMYFASNPVHNLQAKSFTTLAGATMFFFLYAG